ncbi:MAG: DUF6129 family protein [Hydrogenophilaceae bacterium]
MIAADVLAKVVAQVDAVGLGEATVTALRQAWPGVHFTFCSEDDIPGRLNPVAEGVGYGVYLVSGAEHCVAFTDHLEAATGLVLAEQSED